MFAKCAHIVNTQTVSFVGKNPILAGYQILLQKRKCFDGSNGILLSSMHSGQIFKDMKGT